MTSHLGHSPASSGRSSTGSLTVRAFFIALLVLTVLVWVKRELAERKREREAAEIARAVAAQQVAVQPSSGSVIVERQPIRATPPATIVADYPYDLVALKPIRVTYPDGQSYIHDPTRCQVAPTPTYSGAKTFEDAENPGGHVDFALYPVSAGMGACMR